MEVHIITTRSDATKLTYIVAGENYFLDHGVYEPVTDKMRDDLQSIIEGTTSEGLRLAATMQTVSIDYTTNGPIVGAKEKSLLRNAIECAKHGYTQAL